MARKVYVDVKVRLVINAEEEILISDVIQEMDYNFTSKIDGAEIIETEIEEYEITDSK